MPDSDFTNVVGIYMLRIFLHQAVVSSWLLGRGYCSMATLHLSSALLRRPFCVSVFGACSLVAGVLTGDSLSADGIESLP